MELFNILKLFLEVIYNNLTDNKIIIILISGYLGFSISYAGLPTKNKFLKICILGFLPFSVLNSLIPHSLYLLLANTFVSILLGILWRKLIRVFLSNFLYKTSILTEDGYDSILNEMSNRTDISIVALEVELLDGSILIGKLTPECQQKKIKSGTIDQYGNIRLYVDQIQRDHNQEPTASISFIEKHNLNITTYIPKESIKYIKFYFTENQVNTKSLKFYINVLFSILISLFIIFVIWLIIFHLSPPLPINAINNI